MPRLLFTTLGSRGDLHPVLAVAKAAQDQGADVHLALSPEDSEIAQRAGLTAHSVGPSLTEICALLNMSQDEIAAAVFRDPGQFVATAIYPHTAAVVEQLMPLVAKADIVAGTAFALAGALTAEKLSRPYVPLLLQPMLQYDPRHPPLIPPLKIPLFQAPAGAYARAWNAAWLSFVPKVLRWRYGHAQNILRAQIGLPATQATPLLGHAVPPRAVLGLWDAGFAPSDGATEVAGFPYWDEGPSLPGDLTAFLDAHPSPLVVTMGSVAQNLYGPRFYDRCVALARQFDLPIVILSGQAVTPKGPDICAIPYAPHRALFSRARVILHHGGMGTTAQALRAGVPQLIVPCGADQPDNARRVQRYGLGHVVSRQLGRQARRKLAGLLLGTSSHQSQTFAETLTPDGAAHAAKYLLSLL